MSRVLATNNPSAYVHQIMDRVAGKPEFGESWQSKTVKLNDVAPELRKVVSAFVGGKDSFQTTELQRNLFSAEASLSREDKGLFGTGGILNTGVLGGDGWLSAREQHRAERKNPLVKPMLEYIFEDSK